MSSSQNNCSQWDLDTFHKILALSSNLSESDRISELKDIPDNVLICLVELVFNIINGTIKISPRSVQKLKPYSESLRHLSNIRDIDETREFLIQSGGSPLTILLPVLISAASSILEHVLR